MNRFSALAGCLYFLYFMRSWKSTSGIVFLILLFSLLADNFNYFFIRAIYPNSFIIGNSWYIVNYVITAFLFKEILKKHSRLIIGLLGLFILGTIVSFIFFYEFTESNVFIRLFSNASFIAFSLLVYFELLKSPSLQLTKLPLFWVVTSLFIYNSLLLLQGIFNNYLIFDLKISTFNLIPIIKLIGNIVKNFILFYALALIDKGYPDSLTTNKS